MDEHAQRQTYARKIEIARLLKENNHERTRILDEQRRSNMYWEESAERALQIGAWETLEHIKKSNEEANERFAELYALLDEHFDELSSEFDAL
jgi:uncharacterized protein involved in type VI secretion and phage assembly